MSSLIQEKVKQGLALLDEFDTDCWITFVRESDITGDPTLDLIYGSSATWHTAFIFSRTGKAFALIGNYDAETVEQTGAYDEVIPYVKDFNTPFKRLMAELAPRSIALNYSTESEISDGLSHGMFLTLHDLLTEIGLAEHIISAEPLVSALRQRKTETEMAAIRSAVAVTEAIFDAVGKYMKPGFSEARIARFIRDEVDRRRIGYSWNPASCPAVFTGPDTEGGHYAPSERTAEPGHLLHIDFGVRIDGYCSDMQRTFYFLKEGETEPPEAVVRGFNTVVEAIETARRAMVPGKIGNDIDTIARSYLTDRGYEEYKSGLGHQVGRFAHDGTVLLGPAWEKYGKKPFHPIETGMVFTLEPRVFVPGHGVASLEEMVVVTDTGAEFLAKPQTDLILIS